MKTLKPVDPETYKKIGQAYLILSEYPEVFGDVTMKKFCSMFVDDIIDDGEDEHEARMRAYASEMYDMLLLSIESLREHRYDSPTAERIEELLDRIDGEVRNDE